MTQLNKDRLFVLGAIKRELELEPNSDFMTYFSDSSELELPTFAFFDPERKLKNNMDDICILIATVGDEVIEVIKQDLLDLQEMRRDGVEFEY